MKPSVGFKLVARPDARVLILGTLPGAESLKQSQYYAKKQNSFWRIMEKLLHIPVDLPYTDRLKLMTDNHIALWDVCAAAEREGSLDSRIKSPTPNNFAGFFKRHPDIRKICFNGQHAEKLFRILVRPTLAPRISDMPFAILPSTSPAHAGMSFEQKLARWQEALRDVTG